MNELLLKGPDLDSFPEVSEVKSSMVIRVPLFPVLVGATIAVMNELDPDVPLEAVTSNAITLVLMGLIQGLHFEKSLDNLKLRIFLKNEEDNELLPEWFEQAFRRMVRNVGALANMPTGEEVQYSASFLHSDHLAIVYQFNKRMLQ